jgi:ribosomal protein L14
MADRNAFRANNNGSCLKSSRRANGSEGTGDLAIANTCVACHNTHPTSPKRDFKKGDVMGAIVVRFNK